MDDTEVRWIPLASRRNAPNWLRSASRGLRDGSRTPLVELVLAGESEDRLLQLVNSAGLREEHRTAAPWSIKNQHRYLEAERPLDGLTPLHAAAERNYSRLASTLLEFGVQVDKVNREGLTALMAAASYGFTDVSRVLLRAGAALSAKDNSGKTALHHAMRDRDGVAEVVGLLLRERADAEACDQFGLTPLALGTALKADLAVAALLRGGALPFTVDRIGLTPFDRVPVSARGAPSQKMLPTGDRCKDGEIREALLRADKVRRGRLVTQLVGAS
eukprot:gnl/TRDRNA2_/TRDRNA2_163827_c0_seq1.p1 gnl/TRDRNA2_/TRDRNA2_163827_c0~~gnl/TRDRNA2_/TRDRNA2_163827_c0_seq1.p1  ORF type:complete len:274 (-),score=42.81 gnl/TRDRNA2_/TRDRNA2_163827_c0_seq1:20-841(-)